MSFSWTPRPSYRPRHDRGSSFFRIREVSMMGPTRLTSIPKGMLPVYERIVGFSDNVCDTHLGSRIPGLSACNDRSAVQEAPEPTHFWATANVGVRCCLRSRENIFLADGSFPPHITTADLCAAFEVGESTVHAKARVIEETLGNLAYRIRNGRCPAWPEGFARVDGRSEWSACRFARHASRSPRNCICKGTNSLHPNRS